MTQHFVEAVCGDDTEFKLICTEPENCGQDGEGCEFLEEWKSLDPNEAISKPAKAFTFGRVEVNPEWRSTGDDAELWFNPIEPPVDLDKVRSWEWSIHESLDIICNSCFKVIEPTAGNNEPGSIKALDADITMHIQEFHKEN